jgi:hypothetical protein
LRAAEPGAGAPAWAFARYLLLPLTCAENALIHADSVSG